MTVPRPGPRSELRSTVWCRVGVRWRGRGRGWNRAVLLGINRNQHLCREQLGRGPSRALRRADPCATNIAPANAELTTQQAADLLNVSRPFLIGLLQAGEIEYRTVGAHRRVKMPSLMDYLRRDNETRRSAADEITKMSQELGLD